MCYNENYQIATIFCLHCTMKTFRVTWFYIIMFIGASRFRFNSFTF